jgi:hypothetical protein
MERTPLVIVQNNFVQRLTAPVAKAARAMGIELHDVSSGEAARLRPLPVDGGPWGPVLVMGSVLFVHQWARDEPALTPWVFWDDDRYDALVWAERMGDRYLNADGYETTIGAFQSSDGPARHLRPRSGIKMIGDKVVTESQNGQESIQGLVATPAGIANRGIDPATGIWASAPKDIRGEIRVWMIGGRVAAASTYRIDGDHDRRTEHPFVDEARSVAMDYHGTWHPGRHYVVDLAVTDAGMKVVEYNPIHSSGWYAADPADVVQAYMAAETALMERRL